MKPWTSLACLLFLATAAAAEEEKAVLLTPPPGPAAKINGPKVYACGPKHPFLYRIPATGQRPMQFTAEGLPAGLALDADCGHHPRRDCRERRISRDAPREKRAGPVRAAAEDRLRRHPGPHAADGLEQLVHPL